MRYYFIYLLFVLLVITGCGNQKAKKQFGNLDKDYKCNIENIQIPSLGDVIELKSYAVTSFYKTDSVNGIIAYNYRLHSLDIINLQGERGISSIQLQREGPNGVSGEICGISFVNKDSIWVYDGTGVCLLNDKGIVTYRTSLEDRGSVIIGINYAMYSAKFAYNPKHHSLLYLAKRDSFVVEEYDVIKEEVVQRYPLSYSVVNLEGALDYADMDAPNVNFVGNKIVYNYPYESSVYLLDLDSGLRSIVEAESCYTLNEAERCTVNGYSAWERHRIENVHFYDVMYLPQSQIYVRPHLGGISFDATKSVQTLLDSRSLYLTFFDKNFKKIGEKRMQDYRYSCFTGWCALSDALLLFNDNSLDTTDDYENLSIDLIKTEI